MNLSDPKTKRLIFETFQAQAIDAVNIALNAQPGSQLALDPLRFYFERARAAVAPFEAQGAPRDSLLTFFGMLLGEVLFRPVKETNEIELQ